MTELFEKAVATIRELPAETQDGLARIILSLTDADLPPIELSDSEILSLDLSRQQAARGEFASDEQVKSVWAKHGL
jgi:hypothetical protein